MTILSAAQDAIAKLVGQRISSVVSSTDEICIEITAIAHEAAEDIALAQDWQALTKFVAIKGDGVTDAFQFPDDYDRMVQASEMFDPANWCWGFTHIADMSEWLRLTTTGIGILSPGIWTIMGDRFRFYPTPGAGQSAVFPYITKNIFVDGNDSPKSRITADTDRFILDERLLSLALVWRWLALKRMDYQQEMDDYNVLLSQRMTRDKGTRVIRSRRAGRSQRPHAAYPGALGGISSGVESPTVESITVLTDDDGVFLVVD